MTTVTDLPVPRLVGDGAEFARRGGQLRVSFTPRRQLGCWFCRNEEESPPRITRWDPTMPAPALRPDRRGLPHRDRRDDRGRDMAGVPRRRRDITGTVRDPAALAAAVSAHLDAFTEGILT